MKVGQDEAEGLRRLTDRAVGEGAGPREHAEDRERQGRAAEGGGVL